MNSQIRLFEITSELLVLYDVRKGTKNYPEIIKIQKQINAKLKEYHEIKGGKNE